MNYNKKKQLFLITTVINEYEKGFLLQVACDLEAPCEECKVSPFRPSRRNSVGLVLKPMVHVALDTPIPTESLHNSDRWNSTSSWDWQQFVLVVYSFSSDLWGEHPRSNWPQEGF